MTDTHAAVAESEAGPERLFAEEIANIVTHGAGLLFGVVGLGFLLYKAAVHGDVLHVVSCAVYGVSFILLYAASTFYHWMQSLGWDRAIHRARLFDHSAIFLLIAGTYTPFTLVALQGALGWTLFGVVWSLGIFGVCYKLFFRSRFKKGFSTFLYLGMGWAILVAIEPLIELVPTGGLALIVGGGIAYTGGVVFYVGDKRPFFHTIWHLFVLAGSLCHYAAIFYYVVPAA